MHTSSTARFVLGAALGTFFAGTATAQIGHVVDAQKISDTSGGFTAQLDEEDQFGRSIVNLGDLDGDGVSDLLVGAHTDDDGGVDKGSVYVLFLHANGFVKSWTKISDLSGNFGGRLDPGDQFGRAAACLGDLDGDGVTDVAVSANYDDDGGANKGAIYILFLNVDGTVKASQKISTLAGGLPAPLRIHDEFGRSITALGDMDGDGTTDLVVGTPEDDEGGTNTGALHVLFLNTNGTVKSYRRISKLSSGLAIKPGDWFGFCSTNLGDFDGDGVTDIAAGAVLNDDGGVNQGSLWILLLNADGSVKSSFEIGEGLRGFDAVLDDIDQFGTSVANLGDLDGDGVVDVAVGAVKDDDGGNPGNPDADVGAVYVLFLRADATVKSWVKLSDTSGDLPYALDQYDWFGSALARLGGSSGDGLFNLAIGCRNDDDGSPNRGSIYLVQLNDGSAPVAEFNTSRTLGVAPLSVSFTDASTGEVTAWLWNFSDGPQSNLQNPTKTFSAPGTYDVTLTARGPKGRDVERKLAHVTVVSGPLADFSATPTDGLAPLTVQFTDLSEGQITSWWWDFGDGASSSARHPSHVFGPGSFDVSLTVTGPNGSDTRTRAAFVTSEDMLPHADFAADARLGFAPHTVSFTDLSSGDVTLRSWSFGDGATSSALYPQHTYAAPGSYTVSLTVSGGHGADTLTRTDWIVVTSPVPAADFTAAPTSGVAPLLVQFEDLSTGNVTARAWDFGDGTGSNLASPAHVYDQPGIYDVALTLVGPDGGDVETKLALVVVAEPPPVAEFLASATRGFAPFAVQFTDQSSGQVTSYAWSFGNGASSSESDPLHVFTAPGLYDVALTVQGPAGTSTETKLQHVSVEDPTPVADFTAPLASGLAPLAVAFADASEGQITSWAWDFGDGASAFERDPEHVYLVPGTYDVTLSVTGPAGSDQRTRAGFVVVSEPPPSADFVALPTSGFAPLTVQFTDASVGLISAHAWTFGDGASSSAASPSHTYALPGSYEVALTVVGPGGVDVETRPGWITVLDPQPMAEFAGAPTSGPAPLSVQFADLSGGLITAHAWSFGDGASSSAASPSHTYTTPGTYEVRLAIAGPTGSDLAVKSAYVTVGWPAPAPEFDAGPVSGFAPLTVAFSDLSVGNVTAWQWSFGDGTTSRQRHPVKVYTRTGAFSVTLTTRGPGGTRSVTHGGISVQALPQFPDGGFEQQSALAAPEAPWTLLGSGALVRSNAQPDGGFPREGDKWLALDGTASTAATPPGNPRGAGAPPTGTVGVRQSFTFSPLAPHLVFDAAFLLGDAPASAASNDFMSVDLSDGTTSWNLYYADSFSALPGTSLQHGLPMTAVERVHVDLGVLFPALVAGSPLTLEIGVGNGGDGANPSRGYVDALRLVPAATASFRNGTRRNAARYVAAPPVLGGAWTIQVDVSGHAGARAMQLVGHQRPASGVLRPAGEVLVAGKKLFAQSWPVLPGLNVRTIALPVDLALLALPMATQVTITGGAAELCNAYDVVLGF
jgi:PKD repeat protein